MTFDLDFEWWIVFTNRIAAGKGESRFCGEDIYRNDRREDSYRMQNNNDYSLSNHLMRMEKEITVSKFLKTSQQPEK